MDVVQRITELAARRGISKSFLCSKMGVAKVYFNDVSKTNRKIDDDRLRIIADTLFTTVAYLNGDTEDDRIPTTNNLSSDEAELLDTYRKLGTSGKRQLVGKAFELLDKKENAPIENEKSEETVHPAVRVNSMAGDT